MEIKIEGKQLTGILIDICMMICGLALSQVISLFGAMNASSIDIKFVIYLVITLISFFVWLWLKRRPGINIKDRIESILDRLPDAEDVTSIKGERNGS